MMLSNETSKNPTAWKHTLKKASLQRAEVLHLFGRMQQQLSLRTEVSPYFRHNLLWSCVVSCSVKIAFPLSAMINVHLTVVCCVKWVCSVWLVLTHKCLFLVSRYIFINYCPLKGNRNTTCCCLQSVFTVISTKLFGCLFVSLLFWKDMIM